MSTPTITDDDEAVLRRLAEGPAERTDLADVLDEDDAALADRLDGLVEGGLVRETGGGVYEITDSGERLLAAPGDGTADSRVDTPPAVDERLDELDLTPDRAEAVEEAFAFLRYWGAASRAEIVDAIYSENPLDYADADSWWDEAVRDVLAELPEIEPPEEGDDVWRYAGTPGREDGDGRFPFSAPEDETYGSVKHALEAEEVNDRQRTAVSAAFELLQSRGVATEETLQNVAHDAVAVESSAGTWWRDAVRPVLETLPGVEQTEDGQWRYTGDDPT